MRQQANRLSVDVHLVHKKYTSRKLVARKVNGLFCFFPAHLCSVILNNSTEPVHHPLIATTTTHYTVQDTVFTPMAGRKNTTSTRCREWYHYMYKRLTEIPTKAAAGEIFTCAGGKWQKENPLQCKGVMPLRRVLSLRWPPSQSSIHLGVQGGLTARVITGDRMEIGWQGFTSRAVKKIHPPCQHCSMITNWLCKCVYVC